MNSSSVIEPILGANSSPRNTEIIKLSCKNLWKLFGSNSKQFMALHNNSPDPDAIKNAGLIAAVCDATVDVCEGEIFVIMGLSGSGKSTLVRCFSRLIEATAGHVLFDGQNLQEMSETDLNNVRRHKMGMVFQHFALLPHLTVLGNVAFPLDIQGINKLARDQRAMEMIELVGLGGRENYYPRELSGGQQQRVGIARSLAVEPDIWFLDEPFSALDPLIRREMQDEFMRLQSVLHKTIVFITHDFDEAIRLADRIAIMKDGAIVQLGTPEELVLNPATDYVEEFTKGISRSKVLSVQSIMSDALPQDMEYPSLTVANTTKVHSVAADIMDSNSDAVVLDESNQPVGILSRASVINVLLDRGDKQ